LNTNIHLLEPTNKIYIQQDKEATVPTKRKKIPNSNNTKNISIKLNTNIHLLDPTNKMQINTTKRTHTKYTHAVNSNQNVPAATQTPEATTEEEEKEPSNPTTDEANTNAWPKPTNTKEWPDAQMPDVTVSTEPEKTKETEYNTRDAYEKQIKTEETEKQSDFVLGMLHEDHDLDNDKKDEDDDLMSPNIAKILQGLTCPKKSWGQMADEDNEKQEEEEERRRKNKFNRYIEFYTKKPEQNKEGLYRAIFAGGKIPTHFPMEYVDNAFKRKNIVYEHDANNKVIGTFSNVTIFHFETQTQLLRAINAENEFYPVLLPYEYNEEVEISTLTAFYDPKDTVKDEYLTKETEVAGFKRMIGINYYTNFASNSRYNKSKDTGIATFYFLNKEAAIYTMRNCNLSIGQKQVKLLFGNRNKWRPTDIMASGFDPNTGSIYGNKKKINVLLYLSPRLVFFNKKFNKHRGIAIIRPAIEEQGKVLGKKKKIVKVWDNQTITFQRYDHEMYENYLKTRSFVVIPANQTAATSTNSTSTSTTNLKRQKLDNPTTTTNANKKDATNKRKRETVQDPTTLLLKDNDKIRQALKKLAILIETMVAGIQENKSAIRKIALKMLEDRYKSYYCYQQSSHTQKMNYKLTGNSTAMNRRLRLKQKNKSWNVITRMVSAQTDETTFYPLIRNFHMYSQNKMLVGWFAFLYSLLIVVIVTNYIHIKNIKTTCKNTWIKVKVNQLNKKQKYPKIRRTTNSFIKKRNKKQTKIRNNHKKSKNKKQTTKIIQQNLDTETTKYIIVKAYLYIQDTNIYDTKSYKSTKTKSKTSSINWNAYKRKKKKKKKNKRKFQKITKSKKYGKNILTTNTDTIQINNTTQGKKTLPNKKLIKEHKTFKNIQTDTKINKQITNSNIKNINYNIPSVTTTKTIITTPKTITCSKIIMIPFKISTTIITQSTTIATKKDKPHNKKKIIIKPNKAKLTRNEIDTIQIFQNNYNELKEEQNNEMNTTQTLQNNIYKKNNKIVTTKYNNKNTNTNKKTKEPKKDKIKRNTIKIWTCNINGKFNNQISNIVKCAEQKQADIIQIQESKITEEKIEFSNEIYNKYIIFTNLLTNQELQTEYKQKLIRNKVKNKVNKQKNKNKDKALNIRQKIEQNLKLKGEIETKDLTKCKPKGGLVTLIKKEWQHDIAITKDKTHRIMTTTLHVKRDAHKRQNKRAQQTKK